MAFNLRKPKAKEEISFSHPFLPKSEESFTLNYAGQALPSNERRPSG